MSERRQSARRRTYLGGRAAFEKTASTADCLVRNLSSGGARIAFTGSTPMPDAFDLTLNERSETRAVRVVWREGFNAGVAFQGSAR